MPRFYLALLLVAAFATFVIPAQAANSYPETPRHAFQEDDARPQGIARETFLAHYQPGLPVICVIGAGDTVLAVARAEADVDYYLVYTGGVDCEGLVWIEQAAPVSWQAPATLETLPQIDLPVAPEIIDDLPEYNIICEAAAGNALSQSDMNVTGLQSVYMPGSWSFFPPAFVATQDGGIDVVICVTPQAVSLGVCPNLSVRVERSRVDALVTLVHYPTQRVLSQNTFSGSEPLPCPSAATQDGVILGIPPARVTWQTWVIGQLVGPERNTGRLRTMTNVPRLNARAEPNTRAAILDILAFGTPVNLIARNEQGTWVVALLPDMRQAWLFVELLQVAVQTDVMALPVVTGPAADVPVALP